MERAKGAGGAGKEPPDAACIAESEAGGREGHLLACMAAPKGGFAKACERQLSKMQAGLPVSARPKMLLHACCAPCSSHVLSVLAPYFDVTLFWYNPNIHPQSEHQRRLSELKGFLSRFAPAVQNEVKLACEPYCPDEYFDAVDTKGSPELAAEGERGKRCRRCYRLRLFRTWQRAHEGGFAWFCTTLSISPHKDALALNQIGLSLCDKVEGSTQWLASDFKKKDGFLHSLRLSSEYALRRQDYCGCVYSKRRWESPCSDGLT